MCNFSEDANAAILPKRMTFAARVRAARAILGWSQALLAKRAGITQRAVHQIEQGAVDPRRSTTDRLEYVFSAFGIECEAMDDGGFKLVVSNKAIMPPKKITRS